MTVMTEGEVKALIKYLRNPWREADNVERGPLPAWEAALLLQAANCLEDTAQQLADAQAAQALVVERAAETSEMFDGYGMGAAAWPYEIGRRIRALADPSGVEALAALRAERDEWKAASETLSEMWSGEQGRAEAAESERDALAAKLAAAEARVGADADLILDAYKAVLVLHRILDKIGLDAGVKTAENIADRIVAAHPEMPARISLRAALTTPAEETKG